ncbi:MAG: hypothetical protein P4L64_00315, partial [Caulobacteraceae bacterium]|nr:hypothetical protein [Caulobacteraceae bacterium]
MTPARSFPNRRRLGAVLVALLSSAALCGAPARAQVEVQALAKLDLFSTGRDTGFGMEVWKGSSADIARSVIPTLAAKPLSPAGTSLARRLLAQAATAPDGAGDDADLAAARVKALMALGDAALADNILDRTPGLQNNGPLSQVAAEAALITGQDAKACAIGEALVAARDGPYWLRLRTYCQAVAGKTEAAQLTFTLATQQAKDPVFNRLMGAAINPAAAPGAASLRDGLELALSRRLKLDLTPALPGASLAIANQLAADGDKAAAPAAVPPGLTPFSPMPDTAAAPPAAPTEAQLIAPLKAARSFAAFLAAAKAARPAIAGLAHGTAPLTDPVLVAGAALAAGDIDSAQAIRAGMTQDSVPGANPVDLALLDAALSAAVGKPD